MEGQGASLHILWPQHTISKAFTTYMWWHTIFSNLKALVWQGLLNLASKPTVKRSSLGLSRKLFLVPTGQCSLTRENFRGRDELCTACSYDFPRLFFIQGDRSAFATSSGANNCHPRHTQDAPHLHFTFLTIPQKMTFLVCFIIVRHVTPLQHKKKKEHGCDATERNTHLVSGLPCNYHKRYTP